MKRNVIVILVCLLMCTALLSACGNDDNKGASPLSAPKEYSISNSSTEASSSVNPEESSEGDTTKTDTEYYNIVGRISSVEGNTINYTVYSELGGEGISDYSSLNINSYLLTNQTNSVTIDPATPIYIYTNGEQVECEMSDLITDRTIIMAYNWDEAELQFIVLANLSSGTIE